LLSEFAWRKLRLGESRASMFRYKPARFFLALFALTVLMESGARADEVSGTDTLRRDLEEIKAAQKQI
jgi:hypothetical protein